MKIILAGIVIGILIVLMVSILVKIALRDYKANQNWEKLRRGYLDKPKKKDH